MKPLLLVFLISLLIFSASCNKDDESPNNEFTLTSEVYQGFSFDRFEIFSYSVTDNILPDFVVLVQVNAGGDAVAPFLSHPNYEPRFHLADEFEDLESAQEFFDTYSPSGNPNLLTNASTIQPYQVWLIRTNSGGFGKILIEQSRLYQQNNTHFAEITFKAARLN
jgi:hypothetical protein